MDLALSFNPNSDILKAFNAKTFRYTGDIVNTSSTDYADSQIKICVICGHKYFH